MRKAATRLRASILALSLLMPLVASASALAADMAEFQIPRPVNGPQQSAVPAAVQGVWNSPDCHTPRRIFAIAPHYALMTNSNGAFRLGAISAWRQETRADGSVFTSVNTNARTAMLMRKSPAGDMQFMIVPVHPQSPLMSAWSSINDKTAPRLAHCPALAGTTAALSAEQVESVMQLEKIYTGCAGVTLGDFAGAGACHQAMFSALDVNHDKTLDHAELARAYRQASFAVAGSFSCAADPYPGNSAAEAEEFADSVLGARKDLSFADAAVLLHDPAQLAGRIYSFAEKARMLQLLLPFMPLADAEKSCPLSNPNALRTTGTVPLPPEKAVTP